MLERMERWRANRCCALSPALPPEPTARTRKNWPSRRSNGTPRGIRQPQVPPLRCAPVGMTRGRVVALIRRRRIGWTEKPQVPPLRFAPVGMIISLKFEDLARVNQVTDFEFSIIGSQLILIPQMNCHPDRSEPGFPTTRHSPTATSAAFSKESRMKFAHATNLNRKSRGSVVEGPAVPLSGCETPATLRASEG